jgi:hypothetical protein
MTITKEFKESFTTAWVSLDFALSEHYDEFRMAMIQKAMNSLNSMIPDILYATIES